MASKPNRKPDPNNVEAARKAIQGAPPATPAAGGRVWKPSAGGPRKPSRRDAPPVTEVFGYEMRSSGLFMTPRGEGKGEMMLSGPFQVLAHGRDDESEGWGLLLRWRDRTDVEHEWFMQAAVMAGDAAELRARLSSGGLYVSALPQARAALLDFLARQKPEDLVRTTEHFGWIINDRGVAFVLPSGVIGELAGERVVPTGVSRAAKRRFAIRGTLADWRRDVARLCVDNSRLILAVSIAFAASLLTPLDEETGGINLRASSRRGKSTAAKLAASVWGKPEGRNAFICRWRASDNGLEAVAADFNDAPMILDELGQADLKTLGESVYMLANEQGKMRSDRTSRARETTSWRLLFLSTGEKTLAEMIAAAGKTMTAGQEVRMVDVPGDAGKDLGLFETLHGAASAGAFAESCKTAALLQHGTAGPAYIAWLAAKMAEEADWMERVVSPRITDFLGDFLPSGADGQIRSVARRFAVIALGGDLATEAGITGWPLRTAWHAAGACFEAWLAERGSSAAREELAAVMRVREFIQRHGQSRFEVFPDRYTSQAVVDLH